ncbi:MAG: 3-coathanger stack domain-containing protein [Chitinophagaceae bacterium]
MKKSIFRYVVVVFSIFGMFTPIYAQLSLKGEPASWKFSLENLDIPVYNTLPINREKLAKEDIADERYNNPPRFGYSNTVSLNLENAGKWSILPSGIRVWQLKVRCLESLSINLLFDKFFLAEGTKLFVFNPQSKQVIGAFTSQNNKGTMANPRGFGTGLVYGSEVIIEVDIPKDYSITDIVQICSIVHGYRVINIPDEYSSKLAKVASFGSSGSCQVNVNCSEGINWQSEKRGIAMILVNGNRWCTGSLINNTCNNGDLYFLTANHCLGSQSSVGGIADKDAVTHPDASDWTFWWNYESANCSNPSAEPGHGTTNGATVVANDPTTDFALLKLIENPILQNPPLDVYFNGWTKAASITGGGAGIHHPNGDIKKISTFSVSPIGNSNCSTSPSNFWEINWASTSNGFSVQQPGSSGSPIFTNGKKIFGQLFGPMLCGLQQCDDPAKQEVVYGRFAVSWNNSTLNVRQLQHWLDPCNTGAAECSGGYFDNCTNPILYISGTLNNRKLFQASNRIESDAIISSSGNVTMHANNKIELKPGFDANLGSAYLGEIQSCLPQVITQRTTKSNSSDGQVAINDNFEVIVYPNPATNDIYIAVSQLFGEGKLIIRDITSRIVFESTFTNKDKNTFSNHVDIRKFIAGVYFIALQCGSHYEVTKFVIAK